MSLFIQEKMYEDTETQKSLHREQLQKRGHSKTRPEFGKHIWLFCQKLSCDIIKRALLFLENYCAKAT